MPLFVRLTQGVQQNDEQPSRTMAAMVQRILAMDPHHRGTEENRGARAGDLVVRREADRYVLLNFREERVMDESFASSSEALQKGQEIVHHWGGRVTLQPFNR
ncbi:MAG TPA: hypothetical protein VMF13_06785 [Luteitalea sp.]|nr:hypothetical protein [Luteitalea sp.]